MKKGETVKFRDLQIGDYFFDEENQKFQKIPEKVLGLSWTGKPPLNLNAFHVQSHNEYSIKPIEEVYFLKHSEYNEVERKYPSIEESELEHKIGFFSGLF